MRPTCASTAVVITGLALLILPSVAAAVAAPIPGTAGTGLAAAGGVVVNEFAPRVPVSPVEEFVELHNTGVHTVALGGWDLVACLSPTTHQVAFTFPSGAAIPPGGNLLLTHRDWFSGVGPPPDYHYDVEVPENGGWLLQDPWSGYTDGVGLRNGLMCTEGNPAPSCDWVDSEAVTRDTRDDTNDNAVDFICQPRTPGS